MAEELLLAIILGCYLVFIEIYTHSSEQEKKWKLIFQSVNIY